MFERRLRIVLLIPVVFAIILILRLFELQIADGDTYQEKADQALVSPKKYLPPLRGRILDRFGRPLVTDAPAHDVTVHYGVLSMDGAEIADKTSGGEVERTKEYVARMRDSYIEQLALKLRRSEPAFKSANADQAKQEVIRRIARMWVTLEKASGTPLPVMNKSRTIICSRVESLRRHIWKARVDKGSDDSLIEIRLREENQFHPILRDISPEVRTQLEVELAGMPFIRIEPSVRRVWSEEAEPLSHAMGTLGQVSSDRVNSIDREMNELRSYLPGDEAGSSGIEYLCEDMLRGQRGYEEKYLDGRIKSSQPPQDGRDVQLTIDLHLQRKIYGILDEAIKADPYVTGAACVVIDVRTREVLAMVSAPTFMQQDARKNFAKLRDDARYRPLLFRAVAEEYQPGSIIKPLSMLAAFRNNLIDPRQATHCDGSYIPGSKNWHCWTHWKNLPGHGNVTAEEAIQFSCNVFFFALGDRLRADRLTLFFREFILGPGYNETTRRRVTGLLEERSGIIPTYEYLKKRHHREFRPADGRNYAIGQGELQITPLQAANMFATLATGQYRDPTLIANDGKYRPPTDITGIPESAWRTVRNGLSRCVNDQGGTAYKHVHLEELDICGKTGSAQCVARAVETRYTFNIGGEIKSVVAPTIEKARELVGTEAMELRNERVVLKKWPPNREGKDEPPTHAWFAGYAPYGKPEISLAVILEYGGGGGQAAGPIGKEVFSSLIDFGYLKEKSTLAQLEDRP